MLSPMRLTDQERTVLRDAVRSHFGAGVRPLVFGSRAQDDARGGDIDLYVEGVSLPADEIMRRKIAVLMELHERLGDRHIDVVVRRSGGPELPIHRQAEATGEPL